MGDQRITPKTVCGRSETRWVSATTQDNAQCFATTSSKMDKCHSPLPADECASHPEHHAWRVPEPSPISAARRVVHLSAYCQVLHCRRGHFCTKPNTEQQHRRKLLSPIETLLPCINRDQRPFGTSSPMRTHRPLCSGGVLAGKTRVQIPRRP
jgi:hypothetical protein